MDSNSIKPSPAPNKHKFTKTFQKIIHPKKPTTKNRSSLGFCIPIPQEKFGCGESKQFERQSAEEVKNRASMEAFVAKLFASVSSLKAAYAELQMAQFPYSDELIKLTDQGVVDQLKVISELKRRFVKNQIDSSPPHVTYMLAEIQEQQSLMKCYEITMKEMETEIDKKEAKVTYLREELKEIVGSNKSMEIKMNESGSFSVVDSVKFSDLNLKDFVLVLNYALRSVRHFVKHLVREMESANWDIDAAVNAIQPGVKFNIKNDKDRAFVFESFVCREIFSGFNDHNLAGENKERRVFFFEEFKKLKSVNVMHFIKQNPNSLFGKFLRSKYLQFVHPKMEFSFFGNLNQRKTVNSGEFPESEFFKMFAEMGRRVWILQCLAFSFENEVGIFQVKRNAKFCEVYMESVVEDISRRRRRRRRISGWRSRWFRGFSLGTRWCKARCIYSRRNFRSRINSNYVNLESIKRG